MVASCFHTPKSISNLHSVGKQPHFQSSFHSTALKTPTSFCEVANQTIMNQKHVYFNKREAFNSPQSTQVMASSNKTADSIPSYYSREQDSNLYIDHLIAAVDAVERASQLCKSVRFQMDQKINEDRNERNEIEKEDDTPVTIADFGVQSLITLELEKKFPHIPIIAEEDSFELRKDAQKRKNYKNDHPSYNSKPLVTKVAEEVISVTSLEKESINEIQILNALDRGKNLFDENSKEKESFSSTYWILDPIDGTKGFIKGEDCQYVIGLALIVENEIQIGAMSVPNFDFFEDRNFPVQKYFEPENFVRKRNSRTEVQTGIVIFSHVGLGTYARKLKTCFLENPSGTAFQESNLESNSKLKPNLGSNPKARRNSNFQLKNYESLEKLFPGSARVNVLNQGKESEPTVCISDHEDFPSLPLAAYFEQNQIRPNLFPLCCGSLCKYSSVALGLAEIFIQNPLPNPKLKAWDHASGIICVTEAGGTVTDFHGFPLQIGNKNFEFSPIGGGVVVSNKDSHNFILSHTKQFK